MILSSSGARLLGILGTLTVTRYLSPDEYGEASLAALLIVIAALLSNCGISQFLAAKPNARRELVFHASFYYLLFSTVALGALLVLSRPIATSLHAPEIVRMIPIFALASILDRISTIQDRIQLVMLRFQSVGVQRSVGELVYSVVSVGLAAFAAGTRFGGAEALMWATLARSVVRVVLLSATTPRRRWLSPCRLDWATTREFFSFAWPMSMVSLASFGAQKFDNLIFQWYFGLTPLTYYNLSYNFADMPATLVAEQVGDVLAPSFAHMDDDVRRREALLLAMRVLMLLIAPVMVGLVFIAPTAGKLAFAPRYQEGVIQFLRLLVLISVPRAIVWLGSSYLQVRNRPRMIMLLELVRMVGIIVFMVLFAYLGMHHNILHYRRSPWTGMRMACIAVVLVFYLSALSFLWAIRKVDGIRIRDQILPLLPPLLATLPMLLVLSTLRRVMAHYDVLVMSRSGFWDHLRVFGPRLVIEVVVGVLVFVPSALVIAPRVSRELIDLVRGAIRRRGTPATS